MCVDTFVNRKPERSMTEVILSSRQMGASRFRVPLLPNLYSQTLHQTSMSTRRRHGSAEGPRCA